MRFYLKWLDRYERQEHENPPIGIILCADRDEVAAEFALGGLENQIFASKYTYYIPDKEQLIKQIEDVLEQNSQAAEE